MFDVADVNTAEIIGIYFIQRLLNNLLILFQCGVKNNTTTAIKKMNDWD